MHGFIRTCGCNTRTDTVGVLSETPAQRHALKQLSAYLFRSDSLPLQVLDLILDIIFL